MKNSTGLAARLLDYRGQLNCMVNLWSVPNNLVDLGGCWSIDRYIGCRLGRFCCIYSEFKPSSQIRNSIWGFKIIMSDCEVLDSRVIHSMLQYRGSTSHIIYKMVGLDIWRTSDYRRFTVYFSRPW